MPPSSAGGVRTASLAPLRHRKLDHRLELRDRVNASLAPLRHRKEMVADGTKVTIYASIAPLRHRKPPRGSAIVKLFRSLTRSSEASKVVPARRPRSPPRASLAPLRHRSRPERGRATTSLTRSSEASKVRELQPVPARRQGLTRSSEASKARGRRGGVVLAEASLAPLRHRKRGSTPC